MNPLIDIGLIVCCVAALVVGWPFLRDLALLLDECEADYIHRQIRERESKGVDREHPISTTSRAI
jgi:hypothetical protein